MIIDPTGAKYSYVHKADEYNHVDMIDQQQSSSSSTIWMIAIKIIKAISK